jgi:hypothetical protein
MICPPILGLKVGISRLSTSSATVGGVVGAGAEACSIPTTKPLATTGSSASSSSHSISRKQPSKASVGYGILGVGQTIGVGFAGGVDGGFGVG